MGQWKGRNFGDVQTHADRLDAPTKWKKPYKIFVNSMSDLFHEDVPFEFVFEVWNVMAITPWHTYQILTKRPKRMLGFFEWCKEGMRERGLDEWEKGITALPNVWLGVSVENQKAADERIPLLIQIRAWVRFVSAEPLLGSVDLSKWMPMHPAKLKVAERLAVPIEGQHNKINWLIAGGESGPGARPMHPDWARSLRDQCSAAGVPFFFKQWGAFEYLAPSLCRKRDTIIWNNGDTHKIEGGEFPASANAYAARRVGKKKAGRLLDGAEHSAFPTPTPSAKGGE
jgi:protein gp37